MNLREAARIGLLASVLAVFIVVGALLGRYPRTEVYVQRCECPMAAAIEGESVAVTVSQVGGFLCFVFLL